MSVIWKTVSCSERGNENMSKYSEKPSLYVNSACLGDVSRKTPLFSVFSGRRQFLAEKLCGKTSGRLTSLVRIKVSHNLYQC